MPATPADTAGPVPRAQQGDGTMYLRHCDILNSSGLVSVSVSLLVAVLLVHALFEPVAWAWQYGWLGTMGLLTLLRLALWRDWRMHRSSGPARIGGFLRRYRVLVMLSGALWGVTPWMLVPSAALSQQVILAFAIAGISAGGITALAVDVTCVLAFLLPSVVPLTCRFLLAADPVRGAMGVMCLLYLGFMVVNAVRVGRGMHDNLRLEREAELRERALRESEERLRHLAYYDPLTDLPNRHLLLERLQRTLLPGQEWSPCGALLFIDLDNFKNLNDTYGHDQGDRLLRLVAERIGRCVRPCDLVARLGGDEFVVLLPGLGKDDDAAAAPARRIAEAILSALQQPYPLPMREYHSSSSIGVAQFTAGTSRVEELMKCADLAMYQAKAAGRDTICFFTPEMQARAEARAALEVDLRAAVLEGGFELFLQGQVNGRGEWVGAEALLRWPHPRRGMVPPTDLIPIAEESGLILPIGQWVLERACAILVDWSREPALAALTLAVNVSARQFRQPDFVEQVREVLERSGANPRRLVLELTESLLLADVEEAIQRMGQLRGLGVGFALDDFGIGYSSLSYLKRLPLDQLKIDKTFVQDVLVDPNDAAIAQMILALGQSLGLEVIAEGVETEGQRAFLTSCGCHGFQGYLFGRPVAAPLFGAALAATQPIRQAVA